MTNKEKFEQTMRKYVKRDGVEKLLEMLGATDFYDAPASTRFHDANPEGLVTHSLKVCQKMLSSIKGSDVDVESAVLCALCHDICKIGFYESYTKNVKVDGKWTTELAYRVNDQLPLGHGEKSVILLQQIMPLSVDEMLAIRWHMGGFKAQDEPYAVSSAFETCPLAVHLHIADLKATYL